MIKLRFLLLEDNPLDAEAIQAILLNGNIDCELLRVETRSSFVAALETHEFDLILADYTLREFDGISALEIACYLRPDIPFIFVSGNLGEELVIKTLKQGATDYVLKQRLERLVPSVQEALLQAQERREGKRAELLLFEQKQLLELTALGQILDDCLLSVCDSVSRLNPNTRACFLLTDAQRLTFARSITPSFPPSFEQGLKDTPINDLCIGCGEAVYRSQPTTCADIANDDCCLQKWRNLCVAHGILAYHSKPVLGVDGFPLGWLMLCFDEARLPTDWEYQLADFGTQIASIVFERDRKSLALRQSETRLRSVAANLPNAAVFIVDQNLRYLLAEGKALEGAGMTSGDLVGKTLWQALNPALATQYEPHFHQALAGEPFSLEHYSHNRYYISHGTPLYNADGEIDTVLAVSYDITERKKVEQERDRFLAVGSDFQVITGIDRYFQWVSPSFERVLGWTLDEMTSRPWTDFVHPDDIGESVLEADSVFFGNKTIEFENRYRHKDGSYRWFLWNAQPYLEEQVLYGAAVDITERKRILQQEQTAREEAERANRVKDEFLAVLSHELRSPLNPILGWSKLLQQGKLDAEKTNIAITTIQRNAQLQAQLIDDLLDISRILRGKMSLSSLPVDLNAVILAALSTVRLAAESKTIQIQLIVSPVLGVVLGDAGRLQQVMWNLLSNAVKFTHIGGQVTIALSQVENHAQIQITDTGKGIRGDFLPYVFEHFRQEDSATTRKFGGLGLGLAIVRQIVEMHGGTVTVKSPGVGLGATFTVQIPLAPQLIQAPTLDQPSVKDSDLSGIHILVVDDETDSREFITFVLEQHGAIVTAVGSGSDALQALAQSIPNMIISDIGMPQMDGYMLMQQIRALGLEQGGQIPAIALTAYAGEVDQQQAIAAGFQLHLAKPIDPERVVALIVELNRKCY